MNKTVLLGTSLAALFAIGMFSTVLAANAGQYDITSASTDGETLTMTVADKIKQKFWSYLFSKNFVPKALWVTIWINSWSTSKKCGKRQSSIRRH